MEFQNREYKKLSTTNNPLMRFTQRDFFSPSFHQLTKRLSLLLTARLSSNRHQQALTFLHFICSAILISAIRTTRRFISSLFWWLFLVFIKKYFFLHISRFRLRRFSSCSFGSGESEDSFISFMLFLRSFFFCPRQHIADPFGASGPRRCWFSSRHKTTFCN